MAEQKKYTAEEIKVLEGLEGVRQEFDVIELSRRIKKQGDILVLAQELKIRPRILKSAIEEGRILATFPNLHKSKAGILARLRTDRELQVFSQKHNIFNTPARKLRKLVLEWNQELQQNPLLLVSQEEHDLILGSLLGDASIRQREKNSCFRFSDSIKQKPYAEYKKSFLKDFKISEFREVKRKLNKNIIHAVDFATKTHAVFNYYRNLFYPNNKKIITKEILNQLNPRSLAFWICDDGSYCNSLGYIILCTNVYTLEEHKLMQEFFKEKFGLNPTICFKDGKYYYLRFLKKDTERLVEIIKPFMPTCMNYKIGEKNE